MGSGAFLVEACRQLGDALVDAWRAHGEVPVIPLDEDEVIFARRLVVQRCLYGVDRNPVAVDLAKVSLWLVTLAKDHALTFVDHALRHGDSLVGLSRKQIEAFHWNPDAPRFQAGFETMRVREHVAQVAALHRKIREASESVSDSEIRDLWNEAQSEVAKVRLFGDLVVAAFFEGEKPKEREAKRSEYASAVVRTEAERYRDWLEKRRHADPPLAPFHWEIEFPEVFERDNPGFEAIVGNPPFAGKNSVAVANVSAYLDWLKHLHANSHGNADLVAHFFRRAFQLVRQDGIFGLIATKTIREGHTRGTGLRWICLHGGEILSARRRIRWPGRAAVVVSVVHVMKGVPIGPRLLDNHKVAMITAFLFNRGGHDDPEQLAANAGKSFQGSTILGMGFTFDDTDTKGVATSLSEMQHLIEMEPRNAEVIAPFIGYAEVANSPTHAHHRYIINFGQRSEEECRRRWPQLMAIVEAKVKPERMNNNRESRKKYWWRFGETTPTLFSALAGLPRALVAGSQGSAHFAFAFLPTSVVYSSNLSVIVSSTYSAFCALQTRPHEEWSRLMMSTLGDSLAYTPTTCFETFPFPEHWETDSALEAAGRAYYEFRATLMVRNDEGLTETYNRFHDPDEGDPAILKLRELHAAMDQAVLDAYGYSDLKTDCEFFLDYEIDDEEWGDKKKPWRYRWPDDARDEVLARLLELNAERANEEARSGVAAAKKRGKAAAKRAAKDAETEDLLT